MQLVVPIRRSPDAETVSKRAMEITTVYKDTAYAIFARLALAKIAVSKGELDAAAGDLQWALDNIGQESFRHVINLRLVRVLIAQNKLSEANTLLASSTVRGEFSVSYKELEADILRLEIKIDAARSAYQEALGMAQASGQDTIILQMKLDDLGGSESL